ncbi:VOC family protein [Nakamurella aerolata]|uniref:VOC family protein n=1 Tax=Nakamurella aerolata TaxID=1656892 RepID=A0A849A8A8_9ACTN|nr:VOC family protein [Nakamurella aerolata]NNG36735.1 VOC family protein [Nakamurella aerolata]
MPRISYCNVFVDDQQKALEFYTEKLGFVAKHDIPLGGGARWLTVVSPDDVDGTELLLEPDSHPAVGPYQRALVDDGIPATAFGVQDARAEAERLRGLGVRIVREPVDMGTIVSVLIDDTCGNLIQLQQLTDKAPDPLV